MPPKALLTLASLAGRVTPVALGLAFGFVGDNTGDPVALGLFAGRRLRLLLGFRRRGQGRCFGELALVLFLLQAVALGAAGFAGGRVCLSLGKLGCQFRIIRLRCRCKFLQKLLPGFRCSLAPIGKAIIGWVSQSSSSLLVDLSFGRPLGRKESWVAETDNHVPFRILRVLKLERNRQKQLRNRILLRWQNNNSGQAAGNQRFAGFLDAGGFTGALASLSRRNSRSRSVFASRSAATSSISEIVRLRAMNWVCVLLKAVSA